jgi:hypothetical protein
LASAAKHSVKRADVFRHEHRQPQEALGMVILQSIAIRIAGDQLPDHGLDLLRDPRYQLGFDHEYQVIAANGRHADLQGGLTVSAAEVGRDRHGR